MPENNNIMSLEGQLVGMPLAGPESFSQQQLDYLTEEFLWLIPWTFTSDTVFAGSTGKLWTVGSTTAVSVASNAGSNRWIQPIKIVGINRIQE